MQIVKTYFSASRISEILGKDGKTAQSYCLDLAKESLGLKENIETSAMRHGTVNQHNAFEYVIKKIYPDAVWHDGWMPINEKCGSSPDVLVNGKPIDIKCPYSSDSYNDQIHNLPKKYHDQVQMQMMSTVSDEGAILFYLTRPEYFGQEDWEEYKIPQDLRYKIVEIKKDQKTHDLILDNVEKYWVVKETITNLLLEAIDIDIESFMKIQYNELLFAPLKECSKIINLDCVYRCEDKFYYMK